MFSAFFPYNFGALPPEYSQLETSQVIILPVPYEQTTTYVRGTQNGPRSIIEASRNMELYDEELDQETFSLMGIHTSEEVEPVMSGPKDMAQILYELVSDLAKREKIVVTLGGEHSLSFGPIKAYKEKYPDISILQLDAHADLRESYQNSSFNHATVMRQILKTYPELPLVPVGIRSLSVEEADFVKKAGLPVFFAQDLPPLENLSDKILTYLTGHVYITIDVDVLDPSIMPAVGTPEPGGLTWQQILALLRSIAKARQIVGIDVVELAPIPGVIHPDFLAAKLLYKLIGYIYQRKTKDSLLIDKK
jgi:agmatinase